MLCRRLWMRRIMSSRTQSIEQRDSTRLSGKARGRAPFLFLAPAIIVVFAVLIFPIVFSLIVSTYDWPLSEGAGARSFVGFDNYINLTKDPEFWNSLKLQLGFIFIAIPIELVLGFAVALLLNREFFGARVVRSLLLLPVFFLPILSGMTWRFMLQPRYGPLNTLIVNLGGPEVSWLGNPITAYIAIIISGCMANVALHVHAVVRGAYRDSPRAHGGSPDRRGRFSGANCVLSRYRFSRRPSSRRCCCASSTRSVSSAKYT